MLRGGSGVALVVDAVVADAVEDWVVVAGEVAKRRAVGGEGVLGDGGEVLGDEVGELRRELVAVVDGVEADGQHSGGGAAVGGEAIMAFEEAIERRQQRADADVRGGRLLRIGGVGD